MTPRHRFVALLLLVAPAVAAGCGGDDGGSTAPATSTAAPAVRLLDTARVERAIAASIRRSRGITATVTCPDRIEQRRGEDFVCDARTTKGTTPFAVVQVDDSGRVTYTAATPADG